MGYVNNHANGYTRRDFLKVLGASALGASALGSSGCATIENAARSIGRGVGYVIDKSVNYGSVDQRVRDIKNVGDVIEGVVLYPADWALDLGRGAKAVVLDLPYDAWKKTAGESGVNIHGKNKGIVKVLVAPLEFGANYLVGAAEGTVAQVTQRPLETILHTVTTAAVGKAIYDNRHKGSKAPAQNTTPPDAAFPPPDQWFD